MACESPYGGGTPTCTVPTTPGTTPPSTPACVTDCGGNLPVTGGDVVGIAALGFAVLFAGIAARVKARRKGKRAWVL